MKFVPGKSSENSSSDEDYASKEHLEKLQCQVSSGYQTEQIGAKNNLSYKIQRLKILKIIKI